MLTLAQPLMSGALLPAKMYPSLVAIIESRSVMAARSCVATSCTGPPPNGAGNLVVEEDHVRFGEVPRIFEVDRIGHGANERREAAVAGDEQPE